MTQDIRPLVPKLRVGRGARRLWGLISIVLLVISPTLCLAQRAVEVDPAGQPSRVPKWDARGVGPIPWQGIACADMTADGRHVAVGTIAPPGDPNVFLLDGDGKVAGQYKAGERWVGAVAIAPGGVAVSALCAIPKGTAGDSPEIYTFSPTGAAAEPADTIASGYGAAFFHYGDHSNHLGIFLRSAGKTAAAAIGNQVAWLSEKPADGQRRLQWQQHGDSVTTAFAVSPSGRVVVGCTASPVGEGGAVPNLFLIEPAARNPLWSRPASTDTSDAPAPEQGVYGPPAPAYADTKVWAPLAAAIDREGKLAAAADYQGWQRQFAPQGIRRGESYGVRFTPSRPTVTVYDAEGKSVRRFGPETFQEAFWCDLAFSHDGARLLAFPHNWTCRGLAGQAILPADENARSLYVLPVGKGEPFVIRFPDALSDVAPSADGKTVVACWNGRVYLLDNQYRPLPSLKEGISVGGPSLVRVSQDGARILVATTDGLVQMLDGKGAKLWQTDLARAARPGDKPWTRNQKASPIAPGAWSANGGRTHSDLGGQYVIKAPRGLILIDPNAGLSLEQNWARLEGAGLDPKQVRYVLLTHEHGDHAPGAHLWRVLTGAQVAAGAEAAYSLQHHIPTGTGYGFHPPQPVDIVVKEDTELDLAGLKIRAIRLPGHTYGSMGWAFQQEGKTWVAIGDLIMPGGTLGYFGSINFSAEDVLASLRKLARLNPDGILPGHGPSGDPTPYVAKGIAVGEATGWGKMTPQRPDPLYGFARRDYLVVGWREPIQSAAFGDIDGDGRPDVAILTTAPKGSQVKIYLNRGGKFAEKPDCVVGLPDMDRGFKLRLAHLSGGKTADFLATSEQDAFLLLALEGNEGELAYRVEPLRGIARGSQLLTGDFNRDGRTDCLIGQRFYGGYQIVHQSADGRFRPVRSPGTLQTYFDMDLIRLSPERGADLITSAGEIFLRRPKGDFEETSAIRLKHPGDAWTFMGSADFNGDGKPDVALLCRGDTSAKNSPARVAVFYGTGNPRQPFSNEPNATFDLPLEAELLRDGPTAGDFNGDVVADLIVGASQKKQAIIFLGGPGGLTPQRKVVVDLDYAIHFDTRLGLADFNGDGKPDLASFGSSPTGAPGVYIWLQ